ncbi:serine protease [Anaerobacillus alkaliphilus]|uniref:Serine protease n=1 Tax=Anaerobacillus alkaliphilus TaxID=1548597 RepID=A0A4Q0VUL8_9BACI|nr:trypsin-like peptidase domain-containing protein [Anaerobacillus alkaliphilus]RXJ01655.1 serine protease [Anaerobacillus alkaliphilus]
MNKHWSIVLTLLIVVGAAITCWYLDKNFSIYSGDGLSTLAPVKEKEAVEVAGEMITENSVDIKEIIRLNQPKVVQIEREDGELGSGFLYNDKGDIITNAHIVKGATQVLVRMPDTQTYYGTVIGVGEVIDVAVVRVPELEGTEPMSVAFDFEAEVGDGVIAMGSPRGFQNTVTTGIVSAKNRDFALPPYQFDKAYQISAPIAPGSSGGPLILATTGQVIGINSAAYQGEVIGFSIPIKNVWSLVNAWSEGEHVEEPRSYYRMRLSEEEASYLVRYYYESISNFDYVTAYSLLGSDWQTSVVYEEFRASYQSLYTAEVLDLEVKLEDDVAIVLAEIEAVELTVDGEFVGRSYQVAFRVGIENDRMKVLEKE